MKNPNEPLDNDTSYDTGETNETFLEHQETTYYALYDNPHTGVTSLGPLVERELNRGPRRANRLPQTMEASARASRKRLRDHAVFHQLGACVVLTYARFTTDPKSDIEKFVRKARFYYPNKLHYAVVTEGSVEPGGIRLHHNVFLPASPYLAAIADIWTHGDVFIGINPSDDCIRRAVNYVTKEFVRAEGLGARYFKSKSKVPKPQKQVFDNRDDAEAALVDKIPEGATGVSVYEPGCGYRKIVYRNVNPDQIEGV